MRRQSKFFSQEEATKQLDWDTSRVFRKRYFHEGFVPPQSGGMSESVKNVCEEGLGIFHRKKLLRSWMGIPPVYSEGD